MSLCRPLFGKNPATIPSVVLGVGGKIGSGKTTLCSALSDRVGWPFITLRNYLLARAGPGFGGSRRELQELGARLLNQPLSLLCEDILAYADWRPDSGLILDGLRSGSLIREFREVVAPTPFLLAYVETNELTRINRYSERTASEEMEIREAETHPMEKDSADLLKDMADIVVRGDLQLEEEVRIVIDGISHSFRH